MAQDVQQKESQTSSVQEKSNAFKAHFEPYSNTIDSLVKKKMIQTKYDITSVMISTDSHRLIVVLKVDDEHSIVKQYNMDNSKESALSQYNKKYAKQAPFHFHLKGEYIKVKDVAQNKQGVSYACIYFDNGEYFLKVFNRTTVINTFNINKAIGLDKTSRACDNLPDPLGGCVFVERMNIFCNIFHSKQKMMYSFTYSFLHKKITSGIRTTSMDEKIKLNFPLKTLWDEQRNIALIFFR